MQITPEARIGEIAAHHPLATRVFARHGIDFCCGGGAPLAAACERRGLDPDAIVTEIHTTLEGREDGERRWLDAPLADLVTHIVTAYHEPLREELPRLDAMARKVARVHADRDPEGRLPRIVEVLEHLATELEDHMRREEEVLFPGLLDGPTNEPVERFVDDHEEAGGALTAIRQLTDEFRVPEDACNTWRALWHGLEDLERAMHLHIHLENNVLFPRATAPRATALRA